MRIQASAGRHHFLDTHVQSLKLIADMPGEAEEILLELYAYAMDSRIAFRFDRLAFWCREQRRKAGEVLNES